MVKYISKYTGEQIDNAIDKVLTNGGGAEDFNNIPMFSLDEIKELGVEFYDVVSGADVIMVNHVIPTANDVTFIATRQYTGATSDLRKKYPEYSGFTCFNGKLYGLQITVSGSLDDPRFQTHISDHKTISAINVNLTDGMVPVWKYGGWKFEVPQEPDKLQPLNMTIPAEYLVDGATIPMTVDQLYSAQQMLSEFPYATITAVTDTDNIIMPILFYSTDIQTYATQIKLISPTTGDIITLTFTNAS